MLTESTLEIDLWPAELPTRPSTRPRLRAALWSGVIFFGWIATALAVSRGL